MTNRLQRRVFCQSAIATLVGCNLSPQRLEAEAKSKSFPGAKLIQDSTPADDGFYFPGEWTPHEMTIMAMPTMRNWEYEGIAARRVYRQFAAVANAISEFEPVLMAVRPEQRKTASRYVSKRVEFLGMPLNDGWTRDSGPMIVVNDKGERRTAGFIFNCWGEKSDDPDDRLFKSRISRHLGFPMYPCDLVLEGGAVHMDGEGTILTTSQCVLHENRNPDWTKAEMEAELNAMLGTSKTIWIPKGLAPDPITDGHVDGIAAFVKPGTVLVHQGDKSDPVNREICRQAKRVLLNTRDAKGRKLKVIDMPLYGGHMNFYLCNGAVIVPIERDPELDDEPLAILADVFPDREVIGVPGRTLADGGGGIHCITQQVPRVD